MTNEQYLRKLSVPDRPIDVILDTDAYNEIDDQFALSYLLFSPEKITLRAVTAAPFFNERSCSPADGMEKSYLEILKVMELAGKGGICPVYRGATGYLPDDVTPVGSEAVDAILKIASEYSPDRPLYLIAIGAITNVASALLLDPSIREKCVVVWLGGHSRTSLDTREFNMRQDFAAARVVFGCGVPFVQIPCRGVADELKTDERELRAVFTGTTPLGEYLMENTIEHAHTFTTRPDWKKVIWDATAVAFVMDPSLTESEVVPAPIPTDEGVYRYDQNRQPIRIVTKVDRDAIFRDLFGRITGKK